MEDSDVNALVVFLSNPNRKASEHVDTVMGMVRTISKYKHDLKNSESEKMAMRDKMAIFDDMPEPYRRHRRPESPQHIEIPFNARSVKIEL